MRMTRYFCSTLLCLAAATIATGCSTSSPSGPKGSTAKGPLIQALILSIASGTNPLGWLESVSVVDSTSTPIANATVTVNGTALTYNSGSQQYQGSIAVAAGAAVNLSVTVGANVYTGSGRMFSSFPTISAPSSGATWQRSNANTVTWSGGAPTAGADYVMAIFQSSGIVYPSAGGAPLELPLATTSVNIPAASIATAGSSSVFVGIGTTGIVEENTGGISIPKAAAGSGMWLGGVAGVLPITIE
jgi:hypothetical protein